MREFVRTEIKENESIACIVDRPRVDRNLVVPVIIDRNIRIRSRCE